MLGALLALASAATFGFNNAAIRRGVLTGSVLQAMAITVPLGVPLFILACLPFGDFEIIANLQLSSWLWMSLAGVVHFVIGRYGNYRSTYALGANLSGPIQQLSVPISIILAIIYLGEKLTPLRVIGFLLIMLGPVVMMRCPKKTDSEHAKPGFQPRYREGFFWGTICAFGYGISPIFIMKGLEGTNGGLVDSLVGGLISYTTATMVILGLVLLIGGTSYVYNMDRTAAKWFIVSGIFVFLSQMFRYMSLAVAPIAVVIPIQRLSAVFRVMFSWMLNRDHETFNFWVLSGITISMVGAITLTLSTDFIVALMPSGWKAFLQIEWP